MEECAENETLGTAELLPFFSEIDSFLEEGFRESGELVLSAS